MRSLDERIARHEDSEGARSAAQQCESTKRYTGFTAQTSTRPAS
jgi:hypothetical protein